MKDELAALIKERNEAAIIEMITTHPELLDEQDENGASYFSVLAYHGLQNALSKAKELKKNYDLYEAIIAGNEKEIKSSIERDPHLVNSFSPDGFSAVALAAYFNHTSIAKLLITSGADPNIRATNPSKVNALHAAVARENQELCSFILAHGADPNITQTQNVTALHSAVHRGNLAITKLLIENNADIVAKMDNGDTPLSIAVREEKKEIEALLRHLIA